MSSIYYKAAMFPGQPDARTTFLELEAVVKGHNTLSISVYSYFHLDRKKWCVVIIGNTPSQNFEQRFTDILSSGEAIRLEDRELVTLAQRRLTQAQPGQHIHRHHRKGKFL